jgi:hypothetical protein
MGYASRKRHRMTRVLDFCGDKGPKRFELIRLAVLSAGDGKGERTREVIRKEARLLDALDTVSRAVPGPDPDARQLDILLDALTITLKQDDFELLSQYVDKCPWVPRVSRDAVDVFDWLSASEKVDG